MAFCSNCGAYLKEGMNYCEKCGQAVSKMKVRTCPQCGDVIDSFTGKCPSCGVEFYNRKAVESVKEFYQKITEAESDEKRIYLIKAFPVPNTKEDILEFMILASSNIAHGDQTEEYEDAWMAKFVQTYQKSKFVFDHDPDFEKVKKIFDETMIRVENADQEKRLKNTVRVIAQNFCSICGVILLIIAIFIDHAGGNSSAVELVGITLLIISACTLKKRNTDNIDFLTNATAGILAITLSPLLDNGSAFELGGGVVLIIVAVNFFRRIGEDRKK
jgi:hypothetical protein